MAFLPKISVAVSTYGRVKLLEEVIQDFIGQSIHKLGVDVEMLILNTLPSQVLIPPGGGCCDDFKIRVINLSHRPRTQGAAWNFLVANTRADWCSIWDDDDRFYPEMLEEYWTARQGRAEPSWVRLEQALYLDDFKPHHLIPMPNNVGMFSREAFKTVGGYPSDQSTFADKPFWENLKKLPGVTQTTPLPTFGYSWGNGVYHLSGRGCESSYELMAKEWGDKQPKGTIELTPYHRRDYVADRSAFLRAAGLPHGGDGTPGE